MNSSIILMVILFVFAIGAAIVALKSEKSNK